MGHKKRNNAKKSKASKPPSSSAEAADATSTTGLSVDGGASNLDHSAEADTKNPAKPEVTTGESSSNAAALVKVDCERALAVFRRGNHTKSLRLIKDLCSKHENSPSLSLIYRIQGYVYKKVAEVINDSNTKQRHLRNAIDSAKRAVSLSPSSIEFALFYANLLYEAGNDATEVLRECERASKIENPVDPAKESLLDEKDQRFSSPHDRISNVQKELRALAQKANIAPIYLGNAEEKFLFNPISRPPEDPMERLVQAKRPNEIMKATKTAEERRKEVEVRVAAARLLQQKSDLGNDGDNISKDSGQRVGERRKSGDVRNPGSADEKRARVKLYWDSMSSDEKKMLLTNKIVDIREHFSSSKDESLIEMADEALSYGVANRVWRFWGCLRCKVMLADAGSYMQHVVKEHMDSLLPEMPAFLPKNVENKWAEMLLNCSWKPLDLNASVKMPEFEDGEWMDCDGDQTSSLHDNWPSSDDPERAKLLESIHAIFRVLIEHKCLASGHLSKVIHFAVEELQGIACASQLNSNMGRTPLCICFLGAPELEKILNFLQEISHSCGLNRHSGKSNMEDDSNGVLRDAEIMEKLIVSQDALLLTLDENFLPCKVPLLSCDKAVNNESSVSHISYENGVILDSEALLSWICTGASIGEQLASWKRFYVEKAQEVLGILHLLGKESYHLQGLCQKKCEQLGNEEYLKAVEDLCLEEGKKREDVIVRQSYEHILKKRQDWLTENESEVPFLNKKYELHAITNVLKDAESLKINQFGFEETYNGLRTNDDLNQVDSCIEAAIQRRKEHASLEISKLDARIMRVISKMQQLEVKLESASSHDYRSILIPLMKSFLLARVEDLAEKDATRKSVAANEAFLAELDQDPQKGAAGVDSLQHVHERTKEKKKSKENRKNKDLKATATHSSDLQHLTAEEILLPSAHEEEGPVSGIAVPLPDDALQLEKEVYARRRMELEAEEKKFEEKKLEEALDYQRRIENEAKNKHLSKHKHEEEGSVSGIAVPLPDDALELEKEVNFGKKLKKKRLKHWIIKEKKAEEKNLEETLDYQRQTENETKHKHLSEQHKTLPKATDEGHKTLKERQEEDDEGRYQADLKKAISESIDGENGKYTYGTGLKNEGGENNCFLNVIIQSLWHLRRFRDLFLKSKHFHVGDPCVICALHGIFMALSMATREAVSPTSLRVALSKHSHNKNLFQEGQKNDASEVLGVIINYLHQSYSPTCVSLDLEFEVLSCDGLCIPHSLFAMGISERINCRHCDLLTSHREYICFSYHINASALRTLKVMNPENSFDELLNLVQVQMGYQLPCDPANGCGKLNYINRFLFTPPPRVFTIVLGWQNINESVEDITATLSALSTEIDISVFFRGLAPRNIYRLVSVVCYVGEHYHCFAYNCYGEEWILYDDKTVKVIGSSWNDILAMCERGRLQIQILFYEKL